ncbi:glycosyltransferase involved in cell wall biosynthesis [Gillisia mitskevichiae]|uniref:Glycosyltransferase involved in cell wall biosynthesis n=1 Tax=Gillisia mitskevichiae TaxID=270921 RepID=A0A495P7H3_9FLAO|nr:glycosyltransferase family 4 protein [Gillisia mitskevichiae]RKS45162.1 glycosyltransferase involved in cell wall biosynthesis [Gillisia mitskevichiae]
MGRSILYIGNKLSDPNANPTSHKSLAKALESEGFHIYSASSLKNKYLRLADMVFCFLINLNKFKIILIDVYSTQNFWYAIIIARLARLFRKKYVPILHGGNLKYRFENSTYAVNKLLKNAHHIVAPSIYYKNEVINLGYHKVDHIPNPIFIKNYIFKARDQFQPKLLWVRAFNEIYNPLMAIKSLELVLRKYPYAELCMVGPDKDGCLETCKQYVDNNKLPVTFTGKLNKKEWTRLASNFDIFLNTSNIDNSPLSVIEAMALGLPIITTNVGGMPFLIEHSVDGLLINKQAPHEISSWVDWIVQNPESTRKITGRAREKVLNFDWHKIKEDWKELLA